MEEQSKQHVQIPDPKKEHKDLKSIDYLIYANIRRHMNKDTKLAWPSLDTIAKESQCSVPTVRTSISRLKKDGLIDVVKRNGQSTMYKFKDLLKDFERFTPEFLDNPDITPEEKAYLIGLHSQSFKNEDYAITTYSNKELADNLNMSVRNIQRYNKSLQEKEIMTEIATSLKDEAGFNLPAKAVDMHKIGQAILYINKRVDNHEDRITNLEKMLEMALKENKTLKKENELLKTAKDADFKKEYPL